MSEGKTRLGSFVEWLRSPTFYIYTAFFLSSWGDRMWYFSVGIYLVHLEGGMLRLAAIFGFSAGAAILLLGGIVGNWVDNSARLKAVRVSLFIQNFSVMLCAIALCLVLVYREQVDVLLDGMLRHICEFLIIGLALVAQLASVAYKICIEKDWIVVVAGKNKSKLANLNAVTRAIDLMCQVLSPIFVGIVMTFGSLLTAAIVLAGWNLFSVFVEYALLLRVYALVPRLATKEEPADEKDETQEEALKDCTICLTVEPDLMKPVCNKPAELAEEDDPETQEQSNQPLKSDQPGEKPKKQAKEQKGCLRTVFDPFIVLVNGWRVYVKQRVVFACVALSILYMTVLGFDSITTGYIYANGVSELVLGIAMALAGLAGVIGTFSFTRLRKRVGLERTGLLGFNAEIICLVLCVVSIWAPGSLFQPLYPLAGIENIGRHSANISAVSGSPSLLNLSTATAEDPIGYDVNQDHFRLLKAELTGVTTSSYQGDVVGVTTTTGGLGSSISARSEGDSLVMAGDDDMKSHYPSVSIILFLLGIIFSRVGLWIADLVVTQLIQENVMERERGIVNGVQNSLNMLMDMFKFTLVIVVPHIELFGYLIMLSFIFICCAGCFFAYHSWTVRGHLFHFEKLQQCICTNNNHVARVPNHNHVVVCDRKSCTEVAVV